MHVNQTEQCTTKFCEFSRCERAQKHAELNMITLTAQGREDAGAALIVADVVRDEVLSSVHSQRVVMLE